MRIIQSINFLHTSKISDFEDTFAVILRKYRLYDYTFKLKTKVSISKYNPSTVILEKITSQICNLNFFWAI
jgi:hypothetical protein